MYQSKQNNVQVPYIRLEKNARKIIQFSICTYRTLLILGQIDFRPWLSMRSQPLIRLIPQKTVNKNLGHDRLASPKALDTNYCRQPPSDCTTFV